MNRGCNCNCCASQRRDEWPSGPWNEPNRVQFDHAGMPCILHRAHLGHWCGYVGVPPGHPCHGKDYDDCDVDVHGGLTYAKDCREPVCRVPKPDEPEHLWWLGFDCANAGDIGPIDRHFWIEGYGQAHRDINYVRRETESLAEQLSKLPAASAGAD